MESLPVIFRAERGGPFAGEITAVFPTLPGTGPGDFTCYVRVGQHSTGSREWYAATRPATREESAALFAELRSIYETRPAARPDIYGEPVRLVERKRISASMDSARREACR